MRVYCKYSGVEFQVSNFTHKMHIEGIHPIFFAELKSLLNRAGDWAAGRLSEEEGRLLFLALFHNTKLVDFRTTAHPANRIVQLNMEVLLKFITWHSNVTSPQLRLSRIAITHDTASMNNCRYWLEAWNDARKNWENNYQIATMRKRVADKEAALERLIKSATRDPESYAGTLAAWAMEAGNVPKHTREYWISLFRLKGIAVYGARTVDLEELVDHMEEHLEAHIGTIYAHAVLRHIRILLAKNRAGINFGLGMPDEELEKADLLEMQHNPFKIVEDDVEVHNREVAAATAPLREPLKSDYPNLVAFLRAKAAWILAKKQTEVAEKLAANEAKAELTDAMEAVYEDEVDTSEELPYEVTSIKGVGL